MAQKTYKYFGKKENLFFDFEEVRGARVFEEKEHKKNFVFNHYISRNNIFNNINNIQSSISSNKQVVVKLISNLDKKGTKNAINYVIKNADFNLAYNENNEIVTKDKVIKDWQKDFSSKLSSKESWHLCFSITEEFKKDKLKILIDSVNEVMKKNFDNYKYISVLHTHQNNPHIHVIINKTNIFTKRKMHFNSKDEIKEFFNEIRNDFTLALNVRGLNYYNKYRSERNYLELEKQIKNSLYNSKIEIPLELTKKQLSINRDKIVINKKIDVLTNEIKTLHVQQNTILKNTLNTFEDTKQVRSNIDFLVLESELLQKKKKLLQGYKERIIKLDKEYKILELQKNRYSYKEQYATLNDKKRYVEFLEKNMPKKYLSKQQIVKLNSLKREIKFADELLTNNLTTYLDNSLIISQTIGRKNNAFRLDKIHKELSSNIEILKKSDCDKEIYQYYLNNLSNNKAYIEKLLNTRLNVLEDKLKNNKPFNKFDFYEYKKLSSIYKLDNAEKLKNLQTNLITKHKKQTKSIKSNISLENRKSI